MANFSGKDGKIKIASTTIADITGWQWTTSSNNSAFASSSSGGFKKRVGGVKDSSGSASYVLDPAASLQGNFVEGDAVTLLLYEDATHFHSVPVRIGTIVREVDINDGKEVGGTFTFETNGAWTLATYP